MTQRYEHRLTQDKRASGEWAVHDNKLGRVIGHLHSYTVADTVVRELNKMEAAHA